MRLRRRLRLWFLSSQTDTITLNARQWAVYLRMLRRRGYQAEHRLKRGNFWARVTRDENGWRGLRVAIGCEERIKRLTEFGR